MSFVQRLELRITGNASGLRSALNQGSAGLTQFASGMRRGSAEASVFQKQMLAIGTTARYALAGTLIFGITGAISRLGDFKAQLGTIEAYASDMNRRGQLRGVGSSINQIATDAILTSNRLGIAVTDIEDYMARFWSSFNPPGNQNQRIAAMNQFVNTVAGLQAIMGAEAGDPQAMAGGIAGFINAIPGGRNNIPASTRRVSNLILQLARTTPNITGQNIAQDIGRMGAGMQMGGLTPEQVFAVWGTAAMAGGAPSVIGRGVAQLLGTSLMHPRTPAQIQTYAAAGLPTTATELRNVGGWNVLKRLMTYVAPKKATLTNPNALGDENLDAATALQQAGIKGVNLTALYNMFGRQESVRQFVNILAQGGVPALEKFVTSLKVAEKSNLEAQMEKMVVGQRFIQQFNTARQNLSMSLVSGVAPILKYGLTAPTKFLSDTAARHTTGTEIVAGSALALGSAAALRKLGVFGKFGRFGGVLGKLGGAQQMALGSAISAEELPAAISGGVADGSRGNPYWVIISPLSWSVGSPGGFMSNNPTKDPGGGSSVFSKFGKVLPVGVGLASATAVAAGMVLASKSATGGRTPASNRINRKLFPNLSEALNQDPTGLPGWERTVLHMQESKTIPNKLAEALIAAWNKPVSWQGREIQVKGEAKGEFIIKLVDKNGREVIEVVKKGVPITLKGLPVYPSAQGKPKSRKGTG